MKFQLTSFICRGTPVLLLLCAWFISMRAASAAEGEMILGAGPSYVAFVDQKNSSGIGTEAHGWFGLGPHVALGGSFAFSHHAGEKPEHQFLALTGGLHYTVDVVEWVPWLTLLAGGLAENTEGDADFIPVVSGGLGLDHRLQREWSWGVEARYYFFADDLQGRPYLLTANLHLNFYIDLF